ncbi:sensor histidine kinase [Clostridium fallax]|uniref:histidine kinase n=1 Tax=Clostridium fallax TaxID=1533 RepID=A0A1M4Z6N6_9CLOT|nr:HAMP domain-containing sensor histidine kinase [Clostridium fallax]SHF13743.1 two-component system, OmpR family, sensor histidine kinase ArlS [Clostridium fallax]SQB05879.1 two component sensor histidine kinase [Clostridium fallax]
MKRKRKLPIFLELTLVSSSIIITILIIYTVIQLISFNSFTIDFQKNQVESRYNEIKFLFTNLNINNKKKLIDLKLLKKDHGEIRIYNKEEVLFETPSKLWNKIQIKNYNKEIKIKSRFIDFKKYVILNGPIEINNKNYNVQIIESIDIFEDFIERYLPVFLILIFLGVILSVIGAIYVSKRFLKRLKMLSSTMKEIKEEDIKTRVPISESNDEFDKVNIIFNSMMDNLEESINKQKQFVADASHELRTPLTILKGHLNMLKRWGKDDKKTLEKSINICLEEVNRLIKLVNELLVLSRTNNDIKDINIQSIYIYNLLMDTVDSFKILNSEVDFEIYSKEDIKFNIREEDFKQILIILIDNAIKYNNKKDKKIIINVYKENNNLYLSVKDNGIGIEKVEIPKIVDRFYKVDKARSNNKKSFGLGLSIAKKIIDNYNGNIDIKSKLGEGTEIIIKF